MRSILAAALLVGLLLAGCTSPDPPVPPPPAPGLSFGPALTPATAPDGFGSEPSLLIARDGAIYFSTVLGSADARGDGVFRSTDGGTTWDYLGKADYPFGGGDSDLEELADGTLLLTGQWRPAAAPANPIGSPYVTGGESVFRSTDRGTTWTPFPVAGYLPYADRNWLATDGSQTVYLTFNQAQAGLLVTKSTDGGQTWMPPVVVEGTASQAGDGPNGIPGDAVVDPKSGVLYIPYGPGPGGGTVQRLYASKDGGQTFTGHVVRTTPSDASSGAIFSTVAVDGNGTLFYAWAETQAGAMRAFVAASRDGGVSWTEPVAASPPRLSIAFPWIVAGANGTLAVAYYAAEGTFLPDAAPANATWRPMVAHLPSLDGPLETVWIGEAPNHVGPICTGGTGCSTGRLLGDFFEIAVDADGRIVIVWADDIGEARRNHVAVQQAGPRVT